GRLSLVGARREQLVGVGTVAIDLIGVFGQFFFARQIDDRKCAGKRRANVRERNAIVAPFARRFAASFVDAILSRLVRLGDVSFAHADEKLLVVASNSNG